ncbi:hypothetical protein BT69DRAFT_565115 [Atractiella rhizophila]|nr:hypothetical protein BT69DRAFT_565115 [Atractiella rhizophila]
MNLLSQSSVSLLDSEKSPDPLDILLEAMLMLRPSNKVSISSDIHLGLLCKASEWTFDPDAWTVQKATDLLEARLNCIKEDEDVVTLDFPDDWYHPSFGAALVHKNEDDLSASIIMSSFASLDISQLKTTKGKGDKNSSLESDVRYAAWNNFLEATFFHAQMRDPQGKVHYTHNTEKIRQMEKALACFKKAKKRFLREGRRNSIRSIRTVLQLPSPMEEVLNYFEEGKKLYLTVEDWQGQANFIHSIGMVHLYCGQMEEALKCFEEAKALYQRAGDWQGQGNCIHSIGMAHRLRDGGSVEMF